jgi:hypothetical protein
MGSHSEMRPFYNRDFVDVVSDISNAISNGYTHFVLNCHGETINSEWLTYCHRISNQFPEIPAERFIFANSGIDSAQDYENYVKKYNIKRPLKILPFNFWEQFVRNQILEFTKGNIYLQFHVYEPGPREKLFLSFNRAARLHRCMLMAHFFQNSWVWRSHVSFAGNFENNPWKLNFNHLPSDHFLRVYLEANKHRLPLVLNMTDGWDNPVVFKNNDQAYFKTSYLSIVTETLYEQTEIFGNWEEFPGTFFSEKIFKPIMMKHPFILVGRPGNLARLRQLGYKTFAPFIDESYDDEKNGERRMQKIVNEMRRLSEFSTPDWIAWQKNIREIVEHNYITMLYRSKYHDLDDLVSYLNLK